ncbi:hypothetical protein K435DRAFT_794835 [Dendrothele bispora CBS 962.96]|uniref:DUF6699 domain-containing protein n=1 Tax=Dendrothele bispora (strain CBS 962.96) TaxID=1314807 RepID=A0A4S8MAU2_DENBC|nr:hypothetical protein K435DRAFT_794835 [Dendrothele bispora CBS 962.96]
MTKRTKARSRSYDVQHFQQPVAGPHPSYNQYQWSMVPSSSQPIASFMATIIPHVDTKSTHTPAFGWFNPGPNTDPNVDVIPYLKPGSGLNINLGMMLHRGHAQWPPIGRDTAELLATDPPIPSMTITHPSLRPPIWITVHHSKKPYVTVWDVLVTLIKQMGLPEGDVFSWTKRLDSLPGRSLVGLTKSSDGQDVWIMEVA